MYYTVCYTARTSRDRYEQRYGLVASRLLITAYSESLAVRSGY